MKRLAGLTTLALLVSSTGGCGWLWGDQGYFRDRGNDYLNARQHPPMQVPAGAEIRPLEPLLPIPHQVADKRASADYEVPRPPKLPAGLVSSAEQGESVSLLAERDDFDAPRQVTPLQDATGNPLLQLDSDFDRAWASVGRALQEADIRVEDLNRSLGVYYINLAEGAEENEGRPGFFSRLFRLGNDEAREARAERYQVRLTSLDERVQVSVEQDLDTLAPAETARSILTRIQDNLD